MATAGTSTRLPTRIVRSFPVLADSYASVRPIPRMRAASSTETVSLTGACRWSSWSMAPIRIRGGRAAMARGQSCSTPSAAGAFLAAQPATRYCRTVPGGEGSNESAANRCAVCGRVHSSDRILETERAMSEVVAFSRFPLASKWSRRRVDTVTVLDDRKFQRQVDVDISLDAVKQGTIPCDGRAIWVPLYWLTREYHVRIDSTLPGTGLPLQRATMAEERAAVATHLSRETGLPVADLLPLLTRPFRAESPGRRRIRAKVVGADRNKAKSSPVAGSFRGKLAGVVKRRLTRIEMREREVDESDVFRACEHCSKTSSSTPRRVLRCSTGFDHSSPTSCY